MLQHEILKNKLRQQGEKFPIYFDYQATTPTDYRVIDAMMPYFRDKFGNPHSSSHKFGWEAAEAVEAARGSIANLIKASAKEIIFTSGATESNNLAIKGVAYFYRSKKNHIITTNIEHKCVLETCKFLKRNGFEVTYIPVQKTGIIDLDVLKSAITDKTVLVSVMAVNNEIGVIQPLQEIGNICKARGVFFHSDIAQAFGKIPIDVNVLNIDLASISGHKIYGPKGIGALYIRRNPKIHLSPIISGGGQESGVRSGTVPTPLVVGLGIASKIAMEEMENEYNNIKKLFDYFIDEIMYRIPNVYLNGDRYQRYPGNINLSFAYVEGESIMLALIKDLASTTSSGLQHASAASQPNLDF